MSHTTPVMPAQCLTCGGPVYDNRSDKPNPRGPDWRCKDPNCVDDNNRQTAGWVKPDPATQAQRTVVAQTQQARPLDTWESMSLRYGRCQHMAISLTSKKWAAENPIAYVAVVHTLFIESGRKGLAAAGPPARAPEPTQAPEQQFTEFPDALDRGDDDDDLPFSGAAHA